MRRRFFAAAFAKNRSFRERLIRAAITLTLFVGWVSAPPVWEARLYPSKGQFAGASEPIKAKFVYSSSGHGRVPMALPSAASCSGEYNTMFEGTGAGLTLWDQASVQHVVGEVGPNVARGTATATCSNGMLIECAYAVNRSSSHGSGQCRDSLGGEYTVHF